MGDIAYQDEYVQALFDRMGPTYDIVNVLSSFGFCVLWRRQCVRNAGIRAGDAVCDMMAGSGECWRFIPRSSASLVSIDFSSVMVARQRKRESGLQRGVQIRAENALRTALPSSSFDCVVSAFGLKTLSRVALEQFAREIHRLLKPGGRFSLIEISTAERWLLAPVFRGYVNFLIPWIGRICLGDIECYRMLGTYTAAFGSCHGAVEAFREAGLQASVRSHFYGCATSIVGFKAA